MRVLRLPAIHHDTNLVVIEGSIGNLLIDAGTSWYQGLQVERIKGVLGEKANLDRILLTSKRYPCSGGAKHLSESFENCEVMGSDAVGFRGCGVVDLCDCGFVKRVNLDSCIF